MKVSIIFFSVFFALFAFGGVNEKNSDGEFRGETKARLESLQEQNRELKSKLEQLEKDSKSVEDFKAIIDRQDKRIEDVNAKMGAAAEKTSWIAIFIGLFTLLAAVLPYLMYKQNKESQEKAKSDLENFKKNIQLQFDEELDKIVQKGREKLGEMFKAHDDVLKLSEEAKKKVPSITDTNQEAQSDDSKEKAPSPLISTLAKDALRLNLHGLMYRQNKNYLEAIECYDKIINQLKDSEELEEKEQVAQAYKNKGVDYHNLGRYQEAIDTYEELLSKFTIKDSSSIKWSVLVAMANKGVTFEILNQIDNALKTYNEFLETFKDDKNSDDSYRRLYADVLFNKGRIYTQLGNYEEAIECYNEIIQNYKDSKEILIEEKVAFALLGKGVCLHNIGRFKEALDLYEEVIKNYEKTTSRAIQKNIVSALYNKAIAMTANKDFDMALVAYDEFIKRYKDIKDVYEASLMQNAMKSRESISKYLQVLNNTKETQ